MVFHGLSDLYRLCRLILRYLFLFFHIELTAHMFLNKFARNFFEWQKLKHVEENCVKQEADLYEVFPSVCLGAVVQQANFSDYKQVPRELLDL